MNEQKPQFDLSGPVMDRIKTEQVAPRSKLWWQCNEYLLWVVWGGSVFIGALSVAVLTFASRHAMFEIYETQYDSWLPFVVEFLPFMWLLVFAGMCWLGYHNFRCTKWGYKYRFSFIVVSSVVLSIVLGYLLLQVGLARSVDTYLGKKFDPYMSVAEREKSMWQAPEEGRLIGTLQGSLDASPAQFTDIDGTEWMIVVDDLQPVDKEILATNNTVKLLGVMIDLEKRSMHACGVFPWYHGGDGTKWEDMMNERQEFIDRIYSHKDRVEERAQQIIDEVYSEDAMGKCATMPIVERISNMMK